MRSKDEILKYQRDWYAVNKDRTKASRARRRHVAKEWKARNRLRINERARQYRKANLKKFRQYYEKAKENGRIQAKSKRRYEKHKDIINKKSRAYYHDNKEYVVYLNRKWADKNKGIVKAYARKCYQKKRRRAIMHMMLNLDKLDALINQETPNEQIPQKEPIPQVPAL